MAYSAEVLRRARQALSRQKTDKESEYQQHLQEAYGKIPRLRQIDLELRRTVTLAAQAVFTKGGDAREAMEQVKEANLALQAERQELVRELPEGFLDETPVCAKCGGTGYMGASMCDCLERLCRIEQGKKLSRLTSGQEIFEDFRLDYYPEQVDRIYGASPRDIMSKTLQVCRRYAQGFAPGAGNLLFFGGTGLGKTFLSACIANALTNRGFSVAYETAASLFSKLEKNRFSPNETTKEEAAELLECDLLIIDDLGTELPGNFVTASIYSLLNDHLLAGKSMLISTNLIIEEIAKRYSPQIASRLEGNFKVLTFVGQDIRLLKNRGL